MSRSSFSVSLPFGYGVGQEHCSCRIPFIQEGKPAGFSLQSNHTLFHLSFYFDENTYILAFWFRQDIHGTCMASDRCMVCRPDMITYEEKARFGKKRATSFMHSMSAGQSGGTGMYGDGGTCIRLMTTMMIVARVKELGKHEQGKRTEDLAGSGFLHLFFFELRISHLTSLLLVVLRYHIPQS